MLQTYFTGKGRIDYFVVLGAEAVERERERQRAKVERDSGLLTLLEEELFRRLT